MVVEEPINRAELTDLLTEAVNAVNEELYGTGMAFTPPKQSRRLDPSVAANNDTSPRTIADKEPQ